jgi:hypothetical protein
MVGGLARGPRFEEDVPARSGAAGDDPEARGRRARARNSLCCRVIQTAAKLVLEPIFEADFEDSALGRAEGTILGRLGYTRHKTQEVPVCTEN